MPEALIGYYTLTKPQLLISGQSGCSVVVPSRYNWYRLPVANIECGELDLPIGHATEAEIQSP